MPHITLELWIFILMAAVAMLAGRQRVAKIIFSFALLAGIGIGMTSWGPQVWLVIGDVMRHVS